MTPNPVQSDNGHDRKVFCTHYGDCLDAAVVSGWTGFTCQRCSAYRELQQEPEIWIEDAGRCANLVFEVIAPKEIRKGPRR